MRTTPIPRPRQARWADRGRHRQGHSTRTRVRRRARCRDCAFDDPTAWKRHESFRPIGALDDFSFELWQDLRQGLLKVRPLVATIGKELFQERVHPEKGRKKQDAAIAILDIGRMNDGVQQQTQRVYENMALLALDLFARVIAMRIDAAPPFSALFTLWLSTMAAVGLASRSPCSRHAT